MAQISDLGICPEQVQTFTPTPMTLSTVMYYTELNPYTMEKVYVPKSRQERENQNMYFFWYTPEARKKIEKSAERQVEKDPDKVKHQYVKSLSHKSKKPVFGIKNIAESHGQNKPPKSNLKKSI